MHKLIFSRCQIPVTNIHCAFTASKGKTQSLEVSGWSNIASAVALAMKRQTTWDHRDRPIITRYYLTSLHGAMFSNHWILVQRTALFNVYFFVSFSIESNKNNYYLKFKLKIDQLTLYKPKYSKFKIENMAIFVILLILQNTNSIIFPYQKLR